MQILAVVSGPPSINYPLLVSRWIHIGAAIVAIGGVAFQYFALAPGASAGLSDESRAELSGAVRQRWARVVHICIAALLVTGGYNFIALALPPAIKPIPYHPIFLVKLLAALGVFFLASVLVGRGQGFAKMRANPRRALSIILMLGALIVLVSGVLNQVRTSQQAARAKPEVSAPVE